ncbi:glycosyl hydrolase [Colletotrichum chrysophilum]|uniref:Glycosyl hydrolase n=1 Tax=Colletotrichum chrysophilum TaxID=1836956 RepID=A0AAD9AGV4_9PEZI|nr:glycosyl hydrolase [Colletotrichum chrysophilum]
MLFARFLSFSGLNQIQSVVQSSFLKHALQAANVLQTRDYNASLGLWPDENHWWQSARCLTALIDLATIETSFKSNVTAIVAHTYETNKSKGGGNFTNDYYDDGGWWALAFIKASDMTQGTENFMPEYLDTAKSIFDNMTDAWGTKCDGGIPWTRSDPHPYLGAIQNELYLSVAAHLANRASTAMEKSKYLKGAQKGWSWFRNSGMINSKGIINNGLNDRCKNDMGTTWTYNQGVILGALVELDKATPGGCCLDDANRIAQAVLKNRNLVNERGILREPCETTGKPCDGDQRLFKGIFTGGLATLHKRSPHPSYRQFLERNAQALWGYGSRNGQTSLRWTGPFNTTELDVGTQYSGVAALVAAASVEKPLDFGVELERVAEDPKVNR